MNKEEELQGEIARLKQEIQMVMGKTKLHLLHLIIMPVVQVITIH